MRGEDLGFLFFSLGWIESGDEACWVCGVDGGEWKV